MYNKKQKSVKEDGTLASQKPSKSKVPVSNNLNTENKNMIVRENYIRKILMYVSVFTLVTLVLFSISKKISGNDGYEDYSVPVGFEELSSFTSDYNIFSSDTIQKVVVKAIMTANRISEDEISHPSTFYLIKHVSGDTLLIHSDYNIMDYDEFDSFVKSHNNSINDTIIPFRGDFNIINTGEYNLSRLDLPFAFMDVSFKGYPSLLVKKDNTGPCAYYDVYAIMSDKMEKIMMPPYDQFKTATSSWMEGYGTNINYKKREIIIPSLDPNSCSDFGSIIHDSYVLDPKTDKFKKYRNIKKYNFNE